MKQEAREFGGWLIPLGVYILVLPFYTTAMIYYEWNRLQNGYYEEWFDASLDYFNPYLGVYLYTVLCTALTTLGLNIISIPLFWFRKKFFRYWYVFVCYMKLAIWILLEGFFAYIMYVDPVWTKTGSWGFTIIGFFLVTVQTFLIILYLQNSWRVKETFVYPLRLKEDPRII